MVRIVGVLGSVTPPGRLSRALTWALASAQDEDPTVQTEQIDLAMLRIGFADGRPLDQLDDDAPAVVAALADADAVILASPVYRASLTGSLKNLLDLTPVEALRGKPCGIIAMGATTHHYLGVDWHLRDILAWFGAIPLPTSVYLSSADFDQGELMERARADLGALIASTLRFAAVSASLAAAGPLPLAARR